MPHKVTNSVANCMRDYLEGNIDVSVLVGELESAMKEHNGYGFMGKEFEGRLYFLAENILYKYWPINVGKAPPTGRLRRIMNTLFYRLTGERAVYEEEVKNHIRRFLQDYEDKTTASSSEGENSSRGD